MSFIVGKMTFYHHYTFTLFNQTGINNDNLYFLSINYGTAVLQLIRRGKNLLSVYKGNDINVSITTGRSGY